MSTHKPLLLTLSVAAALAAAAPASADLQPIADGARDVDTLGNHIVWVTQAAHRAVGVNSVNQVTSFHGLALTSTSAYVAERHTDETGTTTVIRRGARGRRAQRLTLGADFSGEENAPRRRADSVAATRGRALLLGTSGTGGDLIERESAPRWR